MGSPSLTLSLNLSFPQDANHYLGVAGFVVDPLTDELLVIKERFAPKPVWKLPGGTADSGEDLHQIARREGSNANPFHFRLCHS